MAGAGGEGWREIKDSPGVWAWAPRQMVGLSTERERLDVRTGQGLGLLSAVGYTNQVCGTVRDTWV